MVLRHESSKFPCLSWVLVVSTASVGDGGAGADEWSAHIPTFSVIADVPASRRACTDAVFVIAGLGRPSAQFAPAQARVPTAR